MGKLVAIEGADGVGKNTASRGLCDALNAAGRSATVIGFPRYGETLAGVTIGRFLAGEVPVPVTPHAAAVLYALDRFEWLPRIQEALAAHDVVIFDRYIASNMAYQAARMQSGDTDAMMAWIAALETGQFGLPVPALSIYLDTPWELARAMILQKAQRSYTDQSFDAYEADIALQQRVRANYESMVAAALLGPWRVVRASEGGAMRPPAAIVDEIIAHI
ncbi:dTMP kinase [Sphingomonas hengshuiensis]|uniref:Thymidylate kinase n=1 Tax=Sphingomonas hengshuiensis TaxID=1609977 RepID=A0A7U4J8J7_9SPHN|nr:dTMP kinase [Sphingomonas hengshuiensis]AJP72235.1 thymidylate kinase [Sphingomonas hengshuiensis]